MVAQLLRLKLSMLGNALRGTPKHRLSVVLGLLLGTVLVLVLGSVLIDLRLADDLRLLREVMTVAGAAVLCGFILIPLLVVPADDMDPRAFADLGLSTNDLARGIALSGLLGVPAASLLLLLLAAVVTWSRGFGSGLLALISAVLLVATAVLATRIATSVAHLFLSPRRHRDSTGVVALLGVLVLLPGVVLLLNADWNRFGFDMLSSLAAPLAWTPLGAAWAMPGDAALGAWGPALARLAIAALSVYLLWLAWVALVAHLVVTPARVVTARVHPGRTWFDSLPHTPAGAIAARSITAWGRDSRYWVAHLMIPVVPVLVLIPLYIAGVPAQYLTLVPVPLMCLFLGWTVHNDVALDSTAIWLHVVSGTRGASDRFGRIVPALLIGAPLVTLGSALTVFFYGDWAVLSAMLGVSSCLFLTGLGLSSYTSARFPYPATKPGDSAFALPQASDTGSAAVQSLTFTGAILLSTPAIIGLVAGIVVDPLWFGLALWSGVGVGLLTFGVGLWSGARAFDRRGPEMLAVALRA
ncbi:MAG: hypothetical protein R6W83_11085 [Cryobacterium sp.]